MVALGLRKGLPFGRMLRSDLNRPGDRGVPEAEGVHLGQTTGTRQRVSNC